MDQEETGRIVVLKCPYCGRLDHHVLRSRIERDADGVASIRQTYTCVACGKTRHTAAKERDEPAPKPQPGWAAFDRLS
jgi:ssDNA-binding Zn-finger/Zn-ribbon topoisomerase 1